MSESINKNEQTLIYDGDCPLCTSLVERLRRAKLPTEFIFAKSQDIDFERSDPKINPDAAARSVLYVSRDGKVLKGAAAISAVLKQLRGLWKVIGLAIALPLLRQITDIVYRWVAGHRQSISHFTE